MVCPHNVQCYISVESSVLFAPLNPSFFSLNSSSMLFSMFGRSCQCVLFSVHYVSILCVCAFLSSSYGRMYSKMLVLENVASLYILTIVMF